MPIAKKKKNYHVGGQQLPMFVPTSQWIPPTELPDLRRIPRLALDRETRDMGLAQKKGPGWAYYGSMLGGCVTGISVAWRDETGGLRSFYAPIEHPDTSGCFTREQIGQWERDHQAAGVRFAMQNAPYDVGWGAADLNVPVSNKIDDSVCMAFCVDENRLSYGMDELCKWRGLPGKDEKLLKEAAATFGLDPKNEMWRLPARYVGPYAETDAVRTLQLVESLEPELDKEDTRRAYQLEMALLPVVHEMRRRGIRINVKEAERAKEKLMTQAHDILKNISDLVGQTISIDELRSNSWLIKAFDSQHVPYPRDEKGKASFDSRWMKSNLTHEEIRDGKRVMVWDHPLAGMYVNAKSRYDASEKFLGTYILGFQHRGRLHASVNQFKSEEGGARTYRFSYADPPLQQMPSRDDELKSEIRSVFLPEDGERWYRADFSQQEFRLIVHFAEGQYLRKAVEAAERYRSDPTTDFHDLVTALTNPDVDVSKLSKAEFKRLREPAKAVNFAKAFGAGVKKFALMTHKTPEEAEAIMRQYDENMPFVSKLSEACQKKAEQDGYVKLLDGARIHFDTWEPAWLSPEEKGRGWNSKGKYKMTNCRREEANERVAQPDHPWYGKRLRRAKCSKAMNAKIQGSAARQTKRAMLEVWKAGYCPLLQVHDELNFSLTSKEQGEEVSHIMRHAINLRVPMLVDGGWGENWGDAYHKWEDDK